MIATDRMSDMAKRLRYRAETYGYFDGRQSEANMLYLKYCTVDWPTGARLIFTRDIGHHTSGWFKNPDFERCYHLSLSFWDPAKLQEGKAPSVTGPSRDPEKGEVELWVDLLFGPWKRYIWEESPKSTEGIMAGVHHYRVFCDPIWVPLIPRGEVYSTEFTEKGWKSWSEQHDYPLNPEAARTHSS